MGGTADDQSTQVAQSPRGDRFIPLIAINVRHEFYSARDGVCPDLVIEPTAQTAERLAMFGLLTRQRRDGIDLIWQSSKLVDASAMLAAVKEGFGAMPASLSAAFFASPLLFTVSLANPEFANFTDMPTSLTIGEPPLLLSNLATTITSATAPDFAADLTLDWTNTVQRPAEPQPAITSYVESVMAKAAEGLEAAAARSPENAGAWFVASLFRGLATEPKPLPPKNLADAEWQLYVAKSTRFALLRVYLAPGPGTPVPPSGWNGFPIDGTAASDPSKSSFVRCSYTLRLAARRTTWRYLVAARDGALDPESLAIVGADDGSTGDFLRLPAPEMLPSGQPAIAFQSVAPIAIRQQPVKTYKLLGAPLKGRKAQITLVPTLPIAGTGRIAPGVGAPPGQPPPARSDIYVFI